MYSWISVLTLGGLTVSTVALRSCLSAADGARGVIIQTDKLPDRLLYHAFARKLEKQKNELSAEIEFEILLLAHI